MVSPRGIRNRNPGNIVVSGWTQRQDGYTGPETQGRFATFATMAQGVAALMRLLLVYRDQHGLKTVRGIINRWAPPVENDTSAYVLSVCKALGVEPDEALPATAEVYTKLARSIVAHENGREASRAVTDEDYTQAASIVFMQAPAPPAPAPAPAPPPPSFPRGSGDDPFPAWPFPSTNNPPGRPMPLPAAAVVALGAELLKLLPMFSSGSKSSERNVAVAQTLGGKLLEVAKEVAPVAANEQEAVEQIMGSRELQDRFRAQAVVKWDDLAPMLGFEEKSRAEARTFADAMTGSGPFWRQLGYASMMATLALAIVVGGGYVMREVLISDASWATSEIKVQIVNYYQNIGLIVVGFVFGSSWSSRGKDQNNAELNKQLLVRR